MRLVPASRFDSLALALLLASPTLACGDDGGTEMGAETTPVASTSEGTSSTGAATSTSSGGTSSGSLDDTSTTAAASSSDDGNTTGPAGDPTYPAPDAGTCPDGTLPVMLPGATLCEPFCGGPDDACPPAATGDATPVCTPFAGDMGSGDACDDATPCSDGETCTDGACVEIAFYACQLSCDMDETCPDGMECTGVACGYP